MRCSVRLPVAAEPASTQGSVTLPSVSYSTTLPLQTPRIPADERMLRHLTRSPDGVPQPLAALAAGDLRRRQRQAAREAKATQRRGREDGSSHGGSADSSGADENDDDGDDVGDGAGAISGAAAADDDAGDDGPLLLRHASAPDSAAESWGGDGSDVDGDVDDVGGSGAGSDRLQAQAAAPVTTD